MPVQSQEGQRDEPPFTNIAIYDNIGLHNLFGHIMFPDGTLPDFEFIMFIQKVFCKWFSYGDPITNLPYRFPVVTINITTDKSNNFEDVDFVKWVAHIDRQMANFNLHFGDKSKIAMCCRYENDLEDMNLSPDSFGNGGVNIGSHRVVTPNFVRCALESRGCIEDFYRRCDRMIDIAGKLLHTTENIYSRRELMKHRSISSSLVNLDGSHLIRCSVQSVLQESMRCASIWDMISSQMKAQNLHLISWITCAVILRDYARNTIVYLIVRRFQENKHVYHWLTKTISISIMKKGGMMVNGKMMLQMHSITANFIQISISH